MWHKDSIREEKALSHLIPWCFLAIRNSIFSYSSMTLHCSSWKFTVHKASMQWNFVPNMKWGWQNVCHVQMRDSDVKQSFRETTLFCVKIPLACLSSTFNQSSEAPVCPGHRAEMCWWTQALHFNSDTRGGNPLAAAAQLCYREHGWGQGGSVGVSQVHSVLLRLESTVRFGAEKLKLGREITIYSDHHQTWQYLSSRQGWH